MNKNQEKVDQFLETSEYQSDITSIFLDIISELGEVSKEILLSTDYGKKRFEKNSGLQEELGDLFYSVITLANKLDLDLDEILDQTLGKYKTRLDGTGSIASKTDQP